LKYKLIIISLFVLQANLAYASPSFSSWINIKFPEAILFVNNNNGIFPGIAAELNIAINNNVFKISQSFAEEISFDFITPDLKLINTDLSYGYIISKGVFKFIPNLSIGLAHYISRGYLIPDTSTSGSMIGNFGENYNKIEETNIIYKISLCGIYMFNKHMGFGAFLDPFHVGQVTGFTAGILFAIGKLPVN
jgi:hypothetical protein